MFQIAGRLGLALALGVTAPRIVNRAISGDRASDLYARWNEVAISVFIGRVQFLQLKSLKSTFLAGFPDFCCTKYN